MFVFNRCLSMFFIFCFTFIFFGEVEIVSAAEDIRKSMVKIYTTYASPDYENPWNFRTPQQITGSGCFIGDNRILTNAHVVSNQKFIQVRLFGKAEKYSASVVAVSHESDLAILTIDDRGFDEQTIPLPLGDLSELQEEVFVYGFPKGGDTLSITKGVVSRVENFEYIHSSIQFLAMQLDAAVNSGNSGGPVIAGGKIVGIVMQSLIGADNISYAVPVPVIEHFLHDLEDGNYDGFPLVGIVYQALENKSLREKYKMKPGQAGVLVNKIIDGSCAEGNIKEKDVILSIDTKNVANDGTIEFRPLERTSIKYCVDQHQVGETITINILRDGVGKEVKFSLEKDHFYSVLQQQYDILPSYYIFGGLVFCPLTYDYLYTWGKNWQEDVPPELLSLAWYSYWNSEKREHIVLSKVLPDDVNVGYHHLMDYVIEEVNGVKIRDLKHMVTLIEKSKDNLIEFRMKNGIVLVIDREKAELNEDSLMKKYGISKPYNL